MRLVIASTGASGAPYLQRLLDRLDPAQHEIHLLLSNYARHVIAQEIGELTLRPGVIRHNLRSMDAPFASGSSRFDAMAIVPCSMSTLARIAAGTSEDLLLRTADVFLKERRKLLLVPRETPWSLIHARNAVTVIEAGAILLPAMPAFYHHPATIADLVDTVVFRILDHLGLPASDAPRWNQPTSTETNFE